MTDRRAPSYSQAEVQRAMRAAKKEGFQVVELTPTPHGLKIVARVTDNETHDEDNGKLD